LNFGLSTDFSIQL